MILPWISTRARRAEAEAQEREASALRLDRAYDVNHRLLTASLMDLGVGTKWPPLYDISEEEARGCGTRIALAEGAARRGRTGPVTFTVTISADHALRVLERAQDRARQWARDFDRANGHAPGESQPAP